MELSVARRNTRDPKDRLSGILMLAQCLIDEAHVPPAVVESAIDALARIDTEEILYEPIFRLMEGKYRQLVRDTVWSALAEATAGWAALGGAWQAIGFAEQGWRLDAEPDDSQLRRLESFLHHDDDQLRSLGLLAVSWFAFRKSQAGSTCAADQFLVHSFSSVADAIRSARSWEKFFGLWALAWLAESGIEGKVGSETIQVVIEDWLSSSIEEIGFYSAKALESLPVLERFPISSRILSDWRRDLSRRSLSNVKNVQYDRSSIIVAYYCETPWSNEELVEMALGKFLEGGASRRTLNSLLRRLGEAGERGLERLTKWKL